MALLPKKHCQGVLGRHFTEEDTKSPERLSDFIKVTQLVNGKSETVTKESGSPSSSPVTKHLPVPVGG